MMLLKKKNYLLTWTTFTAEALNLSNIDLKACVGRRRMVESVTALADTDLKGAGWPWYRKTIYTSGLFNYILIH